MRKILSMRLFSRPTLMTLAAAAGLAGCAVTSVDGRRMAPRSDAFADYVESVFRRQSELATELAFELDDGEPGSDRYPQLEQAELELLQACRELNELAALRRDGEDPRGVGALRRARKAPACERATDAVAALLDGSVRPARAAAENPARSGNPD